MHDGPANAGERTITLAGVAGTVIALPDEAATEDLLTRARKRRLRIIRKVRADRWLTGRRWIGGSSPCQADRTSGSEFPPSLMNSPASSRIIRSEDTDAVTQLQAKIAAAEKLQVVMKAANQIVRNPRLTDDEKVAQIVATCGLRDTSARELLKPDFGGRFGFPGYSLTNNGANIRRMQQRLKGLANESGRASVTLSFSGGRVEDNAEACRVRIYHDAKPPADTIGKLRTYGFHWTPSRACWHNAEGRITPRLIDFCSEWHLFIRHNPAVTGLEFPEEAEKAVARAIAAGLALVGACLRQDFFFQGEIRVQIDLGGLHGFVAQPDRNERAVDTGLEQFHCRGVPTMPSSA